MTSRRQFLIGLTIAALMPLAAQAADLPDLAELDLNPVLVGPDGCVVVDAKVRLAVSVGPDSSAPRQLRPVHRPAAPVSVTG